MYSTAILSHILFLNVSHLYSWANEIWKYCSDSVYRKYGIVERGFYGWNQACGAEIWPFLNGKYFPLLISPRLEDLCQVPQCQQGSGYSPSGLTYTNMHAQHILSPSRYTRKTFHVFLHFRWARGVNFNVLNVLNTEDVNSMLLKYSCKSKAPKCGDEMRNCRCCGGVDWYHCLLAQITFILLGR